MYKYLLPLLLSLMTINCVNAQSYPSLYGKEQSSEYATMTFANTSDYTLTLKILSYYGGLYDIVTLGPRSSRTLSFSKTATFKMKIKASHNCQTSYHNGGTFSVTCNSREYSQGKISFSMSTYGTGLGPSISAAEFAKDN